MDAGTATREGYNVHCHGRVPAGNGNIEQLAAIDRNILGIRGVHAEVECNGVLDGGAFVTFGDEGQHSRRGGIMDTPQPSHKKWGEDLGVEPGYIPFEGYDFVCKGVQHVDGVVQAATRFVRIVGHADSGFCNQRGNYMVVWGQDRVVRPFNILPPGAKSKRPQLARLPLQERPGRHGTCDKPPVALGMISTCEYVARSGEYVRALARNIRHPLAIPTVSLTIRQIARSIRPTHGKVLLRIELHPALVPNVGWTCIEDEVHLR